MGEQRAVVWKREYFSPFFARRSKFGVSHGPPKALEAPNPTSSIRTTRTLGAPSGGRSGSIGGKEVAGSLASYVVTPTCCRSGMGRTWRPLGLVAIRGRSSVERSCAVDAVTLGRVVIALIG